MIWDSTEIAKIGYGKVVGKWYAEGISIDSRNIKKNQIFTAFKGERIDGHKYINSAIENGASAFIAEVIPQDISSENCWLVDDVFKAIELLAKYNRQRSKAKFIGVTGSVGKTSVKEALAFIFSRLGKTYASQGNYNNQLGVPISLASMPIDTEFGIFEMGMRAEGEIDHLTKYICPDISIITKIAPVHIESLGAIENIAKAKAEIFNSMKGNSVAIFNGDQEESLILNNAAKSMNIREIIIFGEKDFNDAKLIDFVQEENFSSSTAEILGERISFYLGARGKHQAVNMLAVLAAVKLSGFDIKIAADILGKFQAVDGRGKIFESVFDGKNILLFNDSYNSGPASLEAALNVLGDYKLGEKWQRKIAILSDMRELGDLSKEAHQKVAEYIHKNKIDMVITVGEEMKSLSKSLPEDKKYKHFINKDEVLTDLTNFVRDKDIILVKGSFGTKIYEIANLLKGN